MESNATLFDACARKDGRFLEEQFGVAQLSCCADAGGCREDMFDCSARIESGPLSGEVPSERAENCSIEFWGIDIGAGLYCGCGDELSVQIGYYLGSLADVEAFADCVNGDKSGDCEGLKNGCLTRSKYYVVSRLLFESCCERAGSISLGGAFYLTPV